MVATIRQQHTNWIINCVVCGRKFQSHREHAKTDRNACRQKLYRGYPQRFKPDPRPLHGFWHDLKANSPTSDGPRHAKKPVLSAKLIEHFPTVERDLFAAGQFDQAEAGEQLDLAAAGEQLDLAEAGEQLDLERADRGLAQLDGEFDGMNDVEACALVGIQAIPTVPKDYDRARKRVFNLLAAEKRSKQQKYLIELAWHYLQRRYARARQQSSRQAPARQ